VYEEVEERREPRLMFAGDLEQRLNLGATPSIDRAHFRG